MLLALLVLSTICWWQWSCCCCFFCCCQSLFQFYYSYYFYYCYLFRCIILSGTLSVLVVYYVQNLILNYFRLYITHFHFDDDPYIVSVRYVHFTKRANNFFFSRKSIYTQEFSEEKKRIQIKFVCTGVKVEFVGQLC